MVNFWVFLTELAGQNKLKIEPKQGRRGPIVLRFAGVSTGQ